ncbi:hypothetical protein JRQ81_003365 [Phrynocephalus forsythii]|uniref:Histone H2B n=1 Tax=Phrynocephalus forsythii TaxID=171643 RepID=A0A9Q1AXJ9_9SAUR|nr:hypothetical protein JRQ81_003365 [Phrynocephalus forsythii]
MAAKQQSRKKTREGRQKKAQKKHLQARRKQKKLQPQRRQKRQAPPKQRGRPSQAGGSEQERTPCSSRLIVSKILRQMPKVRMEAKARKLVKTMLTDVCNHVATEVETLSQRNEASAVSGSDVQNALKEAMTKELAKHTAEEPTSGECA